MPGDPLVDALDAAIAKIRYLRTGDIYEAEDHNYIVDALKVARDVLAKVESYYAAQAEELRKAIADLMDVAGGLRVTYLWYPPLPEVEVLQAAVEFTDVVLEQPRPVAYERSSEPVSYDAGNVATNISDSASS
jgi:hypothetical protein